MPSPRPESNPTKIFISYRRAESAAEAGRLSDQLSAHFGRQVVFTDVESIDPGLDFAEEIEKAVGSCKILLAVIGRRWLTCADESGRRRLDDPNDFVRLEIAVALKRGVRVIPVLVQGASMPRRQDLPDDIALLARRQPWEVSDLRWTDDVGKLIAKIAADIRRPREKVAAAIRRQNHPRLAGRYSSNALLASWAFGGLILLFLMLVVFVPVEPSKFPIIRFLMALSAGLFATFFVGGVLLRGTLKGLIISATGGFVLFVLIQFVYDPFKVLRSISVQPTPAATASPTPANMQTPTPGGIGTTPTPTPMPTPKPTSTRKPRHPNGNKSGGNCNAEDILLGKC